MTANNPVDTPTQVSPPPVPELAGGWGMRVLDPNSVDADLVVGWMSLPHVERYWDQAWSKDRWLAEWASQLAGDHSRPVLVSLGGTDTSADVMYLEIYRPAVDRIAEYCLTFPADIGLHVAIGDPARTGRGLVRRFLPVLTGALFSADPACGRVLLEPDVRNTAAIKAFRAGGFEETDRLRLPEKTAALMVRTRAGDGVVSGFAGDDTAG